MAEAKKTVNLSGFKDDWKVLPERIRSILLMMLGEWYIYALYDLDEEYKMVYHHQRTIDCTLSTIDIWEPRQEDHWYNNLRELEIESYNSHRRVLLSGFRFPNLEKLIVQSISLGVRPRWKSKRIPDSGVIHFNYLDVGFDQGIEINLAWSFPTLRLLVVTQFESEDRAWPSFSHPCLTMIYVREHWWHGAITYNPPILEEPWKLPQLKLVHYIHDFERSYFFQSRRYRDKNVV